MHFPCNVHMKSYLRFSYFSIIQLYSIHPATAIACPGCRRSGICRDKNIPLPPQPVLRTLALNTILSYPEMFTTDSKKAGNDPLIFQGRT